MALITVFRAAYPLSVDDKESHWGPWVAAAFVVHLLFQASYLPPRLAREHDVIIERLDLYQDVERAGLSNAVVIVRGPSGTSRPMWPEDLVRNELDPYSRSVVYVRDLGVRNRELLRLFPGRRYFIYDRGAISRTHPARTEASVVWTSARPSERGDGSAIANSTRNQRRRCSWRVRSPTRSSR